MSLHQKIPLLHGMEKAYPFEAWNADQTLQSAMNSSVNWYFQSVDEQLGAADVSTIFRKLDMEMKT